MKILAFIELDSWNALQQKNPIELPLVKRVRQFAKATGADVHFSHLVYDNVLQTEGNPDHDDTRIRKVRDQLLLDESAWLNQLTNAFSEDNISATSSTTFKRVTPNSLISEIESHSPDFVFKVSRDHSFVLGLLSNLDWELLRRSPVPVWFVKSSLPSINNMVSAIDFVDDDDEALVGPEAMLDYEVLKLSSKVSQALNADIKMVHAYSLDTPILPVVASAGPTTANVALSANTMELLAEVKAQHEQTIRNAHRHAVEKLAEFFGYSEDDVMVMEGNPSVVITTLAEQVGAGLIVMGANNLSRWERPFRNLNAEPTLADANCDVLYLNSKAIS